MKRFKPLLLCCFFGLFFLNLTQGFAQIVDNTIIYKENKFLSFSPVETLLANEQPIDTIVFIGSYKTQSFILEKSLPFQKGDTLLTEKLQQAYEQLTKQQLYSTILISAKTFSRENDVQPLYSRSDTIIALENELKVQSKKKLTAVLITLHEKYNIKITPSFSLYGTNYTRLFANPTITNFNINAVAFYRNLSGFTDALGFLFGFGFQPYLSIFYTTPYLFSNINVGLGLEVGYEVKKNLTIRSKTGQPNLYSNYHSFGRVSLNYQPASFHLFSFSFQVSYLEVADSIRRTYPLSLLANNSNTIYPTFSLNYEYRNIDNPIYPMKGFWLKGELQKIGIPFSKELDITMFKWDLRIYYPLIEHLSIALWGYGKISFFDNIVPNHERILLGYDFFVRGQATKIFEGDNIIFASAELRYALFPLEYTEPNLFENNKERNIPQLGVYLSLFFDAGTTWYNPATIIAYPNGFVNLPYAITTSFQPQNILYGYGIGLALVSQYGITTRCDFCFNNQWKFEFVLGTSVSF